MLTGVLCIGDELLKGAVVNTNLSYIGARLLEAGMTPEISVEMPDRPDAVVEALDAVMRKVDIVVTSGGLGPTADDLTKQSIAEYLGLKLVMNEEAAAAIRARWDSLKRGPLPMNFMSQALIPEGARMMPNHWGVAPGIDIDIPARAGMRCKRLFMLPGPPQELDPMFDSLVFPAIRAAMDERLYSHLYHVSGVSESRVEERMQPVIAAVPEISVAYCASPEFVKLFITSRSERALIESGGLIRAEFADELLSDQSSSTAAEVVFLLGKAGGRLSLAESCTGGLIAKLITDVPGSSSVFDGGIVSYSNEVKREFLGVSVSTLEKHGAVSGECAAEMLSGIASRFKTAAAISVTGIAGPDGGTPEKPVGLVFIGVKYQDRFEVFRNEFRGSRDQVRTRSAAFALNKLRVFIREANRS